MHAIPHRYPFLLIDRVVDVVRNRPPSGSRMSRSTNRSSQGHFPNHPVMPGVLIIESMAQTAACWWSRRWGRSRRQGGLLHVDRGGEVPPPGGAGRPASHPCHQGANRGNVWKFSAVARVDGVSVAEATYAAMIMDRAAAVDRHRMRSKSSRKQSVTADARNIGQQSLSWPGPGCSALARPPGVARAAARNRIDEWMRCPH